MCQVNIDMYLPYQLDYNQGVGCINMLMSSMSKYGCLEGILVETHHLLQLWKAGKDVLFEVVPTVSALEGLHRMILLSPVCHAIPVFFCLLALGLAYLDMHILLNSHLINYVVASASRKKF